MNLVECATCGYPLTKDERFGLVELGGKMHKPWVGLTEDEISSVSTECFYDDRYIARAIDFAKGIEAKLREKNAYGWQPVDTPTECLDELRGGDAT